MSFGEVWAIFATAGCIGLAVRLFLQERRWRRVRTSSSQWAPPVLDAGRYQVVMHFEGETRELAHGFDPVAARHAYENAALQPGVVVEFFEWGKCRGKREA